MNSKDIPAFPTTQFEHGGEDDGMTLRDYFAAKAMQGLLASDEYSNLTHAQVARLAYEQADEMLRARAE